MSGSDGTIWDKHAWLFHQLFAHQTNYQNVFQFYDYALKQYQVSRVLDLGCGSGLLAPHFVNAHYNYVGIDNSEAMLAIARKGEPRAHFHFADMRHFEISALPVPHLFDAAICTGRTLGLMPTDSDLDSCLACAARALTPAGVFACDVASTDALKKGLQVPDSQFEIFGGVSIEKTSTIHLREAPTSKYVNRSIINVNVKGELVKKLEYEVEMRAFSRSELKGFLHKAGFTRGFQSISYRGLNPSLFAFATK